ncbi:hypothetical protein UCDDA912_g02633 [Diaporthe ampelina]|uniref:Uncharacterized protein n=1 Tax=Diaporthe ampelina TaxID=1214573 RepID=A0A0G2ICH8_9PEZI|nr:hypothetical protein UCDDA912_g02633 [Diaporthe ampelina]
MYFRDIAGMNHISHSLLSCLALGATPDDLQARYQDEGVNQRPMPPIDAELLEKMYCDVEVLYANLCVKPLYQTFLRLFERLIEERGWKAVVQEHLFSRTKIAERMLASMFDGLYHPFIHLGLGVEFQLPGLVAEALAQAASNDDSHLPKLFGACETAAATTGAVAVPARQKSLLDLMHEVRANDRIRNAPQWSDLGLKLKNGLVGRACDDFAQVAGQFTIEKTEEALARRTAEMISTVAFVSGAAQQKGRKTKIDFFVMHSVTSSIFASVMGQQCDWISLEDRIRLMEWKARTDLAWYAVAGSPELDGSYVSEYGGQASQNSGEWSDIFMAVVKEHDDGHAAKFIRALKNGELVGRQYEKDSTWAGYFPMKGDMWLKLANMCQDTTTNRPINTKWVMFTGFPEAWTRPDLAS